MITTKSLTTAVSALSLVLLLPSYATAQGYAIRTQVTGPTNALWDLSKVSNLKDITIELDEPAGLHISFAAPFTQSGAGKLAGAGQTQVSVHYQDDSGQPVDVPPFTATYTTKGSISSAKGVGKISFTTGVSGLASIEGADRKVTAKAVIAANILASANSVTGRSTFTVSAAGLGASSQKDPFVDVIPAELGDGSWNLTLNYQTTTGTKLGGTAVVKLSSEQEYPFNVTGSYSAKTQQSKLTLKGKDAGLGSSLTVIVANNVTVVKITGRVSGQSVNVP